MAKAHITTQHGTTIVIEGDAKEVAAVVSQIQSVGSSSRRESRTSKPKREARDRQKRESASDLIVTLKEESFFDKPKALSEITAKLEETGHLIPVTSLSGVMLGLVQKRILSRVKREGVWVYGKR
jgi:hypothetical protein